MRKKGNKPRKVSNAKVPGLSPEIDALKRQLEIEAALEKVRVRANSMRHSDQLKEVIQEVFEQLHGLGLKPHMCSIDIIKKGSKDLHTWVATASGDYPQEVVFPYIDHPIFHEYHKARRNRKSLYTANFPKGVKDSFFDYAFAETGLKSASKKRKQFIYESSTYTQSSAITRNLSIWMVNYDGNVFSKADNDILVRFTKVFDQSYIRFQDLKKAEEQARESKIELALERVRARTMAMQHSKELPEVALVIWEQLDELKLEGLPGCAIHVNDDNQGTFDAWAAFPDVVKGERKVTMAHAMHDQHCIWVYREWDKYYRAGETGFSVICNKKQLNEFIDWFAPYIPIMAEEMRSLKLDKLHVNGVAFSNGILGAPSVEPLSKETWSVFKRLAGVFDMAYRRFEDLKKAEEQAREAQIEAALERIRNRTLLMKDSSELNDAVAVFFQQFQTLDLLPAEARTYFCDIDAETDTAEVWMTHADGTVMKGSHQTPLTKSASLSQYYRAWKDREPVLERNYTGKGLTEYLRFVSSLPHVKVDKDYKRLFRSPPKRIVMTDANFLQGNIGIMTFEPLGQEAKDTLIRFAKVFEFTYTRFLDLQKAEEQAREAQVEAALERVRARAMAMHDSNELAETSAILFDQFLSLGFQSRRCGFALVQEDDSIIEIWSTGRDEKNQAVLISGFLYFDQHPRVRDAVDAWKRKDEIFTYELHGKELQKFYKATIRSETFSSTSEISDEMIDKVLSTSTSEYSNFAMFDRGMLYAFTEEPLTQTELQVLSRFSTAFELTYRRFLDLQKAEAQAREAQIESALERIRARALGMHSSDEILEVANVLREEMGLLGQPELAVSAVQIYTEGAETFDSWWAFMPEGTSKRKIITGISNFRINTSAVAREWVKGHQSDENDYTIYATGKRLRDWQQELAASEPEVIKSYGNKLPHEQYYHLSDFTGGALCMVSSKEPSQESKYLQKRAASVFDLAYKRFLDLKMAEEQAREAQIEASLERVRAKAMAMHNSEDLVQTVGQLFLELNSLSISLLRCGVGRIHQDTREVEVFTFSGTENGEPVPVVGKAILTGHPVLNGCFEHWKKQEEYHPVLKGASLKKYYQALGSDFKLPGKQDSKVQYGYFFQFPTGALYTFTETPFTEEELSIFRKFSSVVGLTYRRYLDLMEAEAQTREAQIEVSLERVRAASLAMHKTDELGQVVEVLFKQFSELDLDFFQVWINIFFLEEGYSNCWFSPVEGVINESYTAVIPLAPFEKSSIKSWRAGEEFSYLSWKGRKEVDEIMQELSKMTGHPSFNRIQKKKRMDRLEVVDSNHKYGVVAIAKNDDITDEDHSILRRFTKVFEQTYTRFLDLKKSEAQTREAQIEASLERVRAKAMAMHSSEDLTKTVGQLFLELDLLDVNILRCGVGRIHKDTRVVDLFTFTRTKKGEPVPVLGTAILEGHPALEGCFRGWLKQKEHHAVLKGASLKKYYQAIKTDFKLPVNQSSQVQYGYYLPFTAGCLYTFSETPFTEEELVIFRKFTSVVGLTYRRYLDLMEAEDQTREAQIEAALERVRSAAMAMHSSDDLFSVAEVLHDQLAELGQKVLESSIIHIYPEDLPTFDGWYSYRSTEDESRRVMDRALIPKDACSWTREVISRYQSNEHNYVIESRGKMLMDWYRVLENGVAPAVIDYDENGKHHSA